MELATLISPELIFPHLDSPDRFSLLRDLALRITAGGHALGDAEGLFKKLLEREELCSTGIGDGVAIPHCKLDNIPEVLLAIARLERGIEFGARDQKPVRLFFCVVSPSAQPAAHLQCLAAISSWLQVKENGEKLLALEDGEAIWQLFQKGEG